MSRIIFYAGLIFLFVTGIVPVQAQMTLLDDFNRTNSNTVGNSWTETESSSPAGAQINTNLLRLGSTTAGRDYITQDVSTLYNTVYNSNSTSLTWAFNMRQTRTDPSGFDAGNYGIAFVLGCTTPNFLSGSGYAVVLGNTGTVDNIRLVKFTGLSMNSTVTTLIFGSADYGSEYLTLKVTYNPVGDLWSLYVGSNTASFVDPSLATFTQTGSTVSDAAYTGNDLLYLGCFWNHNTASTDFGYFDNIYIPNACTLSPEPTVQSSAPVAGATGANSVNLSWTRGNGTECIVIGHKGGSVITVPADGASYVSSTVFGSGTLMAANEYVVYSGSAGSAIITSLVPNTSYEFRVFEFNGTGCTSNYLTTNPAVFSVLTGSCVTDPQPTLASSGVSASNIQATSMTVSWTRGNGNYSMLVVKAGSPVTSVPLDGNTYLANTTFGLGDVIGPVEYVMYSGTGSSVTINGLQPSTTYYFAVFELNGSGCNTNYLESPYASGSGLTPAVPSYNNYFGNLHSHSDYSDGDMDNVCNGANSPYCCYSIANTAMNFDFMGISDHNHNEGPVMTPAKYASGLNEAATYNSNFNDFVALYGMEWGTISTGGHVTVYGINQLIGWNSGNYDVYCAKGDYNSLFNMVANTPGAFATLCHPNNSDFSNIKNIAYNAVYDNAIVGVAIKNGPYNSTSTAYNDPALSTTVSYYNSMLSKGYHLGPTIDQDNHNSNTMGKTSQGRTVVLATSLNKTAILDAIMNMRFYATEDYNLNAAFTVNSIYPMGSIVTASTDPVLRVNVSDADGESFTSIKIWYGVPGSNALPTLLTSVNNASSLTFTHVFSSGTYYYYAEITEADGNFAMTSPVWYTKTVNPLPVELLSFSGKAVSDGNLLEWSTASEINNDYFVLERSREGSEFREITRESGRGNSTVRSDYHFVDQHPYEGINYYRLRQSDYDGSYTYSDIIAIKSLNPADNFSVFPNPASEKIYVINKNKDRQAFSVRLISSLGNVVMQSVEKYVKSCELNVEFLAEGFYSLQVITEDRIYHERILISRKK